jgi:hypothetical protein
MYNNLHITGYTTASSLQWPENTTK